MRRPVTATWSMSAARLGRELDLRHLSLRANGSRESAPDDRLSEAIQSLMRGPGLLRRFAPRNDKETVPNNKNAGLKGRRFVLKAVGSVSRTARRYRPARRGRHRLRISGRS